MENKIFLKIMLFFIIITFASIYAQDPLDYFANKRSVLVQFNSSTSVAHYYFSFAEIDNNYLGLIVSENFQFDPVYNAYDRKAQWYSNPPWSPGYYNNSNQFYYEQILYDDIKKMNGIVSVDLGAGKFDPVLVRDNQLQVHRNENNTISGIVQSSTSGLGTYITKGRFDKDDDYDDVGIKSGNYIKIFRNQRNGYLDLNTSYTFPINTQKFLISQINDYIDLFRESSSNSNKEDFVGIVGTNIMIYNNDNNNGLVYATTINPSLSYIYDIDVADFNNDGYNDVIVVGYNSTDSYAKVYLNNSGTIQTSPSFSSVVGTSYNRLLKAKDLNMDGYSDFIILGYEGAGKVFINSNYGANFSLVQTIPSFVYFGLMDQVELIDIYNKGGLALVVSGCGSSGNPPYPKHGIYIADAVTQDANPAPPHIFKKYVQTGIFWRPQIKVKDCKDRDIAQYQIWKKGVGSSEYINFATIPNTQTEWTDMSEYIEWSEGGDYPPDNCYYYVKCIDQTYNASLASNEIGYHVQGPVPPPPPGDYFSNSSEINLLPKEYNILNFPNPFNPVTKIMYSLPKDGFVKITIYDILGREIVKVTNEFKKKGSYFCEFNASKYSSGIYLYTFEVNNFRLTKSMLLVK